MIRERADDKRTRKVQRLSDWFTQLFSQLTNHGNGTTTTDPIKEYGVDLFIYLQNKMSAPVQPPPNPDRQQQGFSVDTSGRPLQNYDHHFSGVYPHPSNLRPVELDTYDKVKNEFISMN